MILADCFRLFIRCVRTYGMPLPIETAPPGGEKPDGQAEEVEQTTPDSAATEGEEQAAADQNNLAWAEPQAEAEEDQDSPPCTGPDDKPKARSRGPGILVLTFVLQRSKYLSDFHVTQQIPIAGGALRT